MLFFVRLLVSLALSFLASLLAPKPKPPEAATLEDFDIPKAQEGEELPKFFGTVTHRNPQVAWYGDLRTVPIKEGGKK